ncbi:hypothetical protein RFI_11456 [Reticulomyxa filosa]|uniref:Uncharacterized protein n=1 Tax=Reticulomyxa filosa TaxID=46433 RepID=X6NI50_RETFI|nr:hypothetical protein RFI_11456 [Reticulomyxa filosa]|eukprot:ETO25681.1 hypothetical protein RFI_11456 [Reticulomyxa filosa]
MVQKEEECYFEHEWIIKNWLRKSEVNKKVGWINEFDKLIAQFGYFSICYLSQSYKIGVFPATNAIDQKIVLFNHERDHSVEWFGSIDLEPVRSALRGHGGTMLWIKDISPAELKDLDLEPEDLTWTNARRHALIRVNSQSQNMCMVLSEKQISACKLPPFPVMSIASTLLYHKDIGLVAVGQCNKCAILKPKCDPTSVAEWQINTRTQDLHAKCKLSCGMIYEMNQILSDDCPCRLLTLCDGTTNMYDVDMNKWTNLENNSVCKHGVYAYMQQWRGKNNDNVLVINGVGSQAVSEFDMHKNVWNPLPTTIHCHSNICSKADMTIDKDNGVVKIMSFFHAGGTSKRGRVEIFDHRDSHHTTWKLLDVESSLLTTIFPFDFDDCYLFS